MATTGDFDSKKREPTVVFRLSGVGLAWYIIPLPTFAFISCVLISLWKDFDRSTATHCGVSFELESGIVCRTGNK